MNSIVKVIEQKVDIFSGKESSVLEIENAEKKLKLKFSDDYREYLEKLSIVSFEGRELTGLTPVERLNVVTVTERERKRCPEARSQVYVIEETLIDDIVFWQSETGEVYCTYGSGPLIKSFESFEEYLTKS